MSSESALHKEGINGKHLYHPSYIIQRNNIVGFNLRLGTSYWTLMKQLIQTRTRKLLHDYKVICPWPRSKWTLAIHTPL